MNKKDKVWGIGLGRTSTKSLCKGLNILGYNAIHNPPNLEAISSPDINAAAEGTTAFHFKYLDLRFPDSRFILTTRELFSWLKSCERAINNLYPMDRFNETDEFYNPMVRNRANRYGCLEYDRERLIEKYYQHHADVISHFKGRMHKCLIMNIPEGDSWEKLCPFLEQDIPEAPFPCVREK
jgi:hypothetical protein